MPTSHHPAVPCAHESSGETGTSTRSAIAPPHLSRDSPTSIPSASLARRHDSARSRKHHNISLSRHQQPFGSGGGDPGQSNELTPLSPMLQDDHHNDSPNSSTASGIPHHALPHLHDPDTASNNNDSVSSPQSFEPSSGRNGGTNSCSTTPVTPTRKPSKGALLLSIPQTLLRSTLGRQSSLRRDNEQQHGPQDVTLQRLQDSHQLPTLDGDALQSLGRALSERNTASPTTAPVTSSLSTLPMSPNTSQLPDKVALSKAQLKQIAPTVLQQPEAACERLGVRPLSAVSSAFEIDLGQFVPAMNVLSPAACDGSHPIPDLTPFEHSAKLDLLYQLLASRSVSGTIDADTIRSVLTEALGNNALYLSPGDLEILTGVLLAKLDVDGDGAVSAMDFKLATRSWNLAGIGLPAAPSAKAKVDIFGLDYLALNANKSSSPDGTDASRITQTPRSMKRRSRVRSASRWMLDRTPSQLWEADALQPIPTASTPIPSPGNSNATSPSTSHAQAPSSSNINAPLKPSHPSPSGGPAHNGSPVTSYLKLEGGKLICVGLFCTGAFAVFTWRLLLLLSVSKLGLAVGWPLAIASGTAHIVLFCVAFSFLLMCRRLLTLIRDVPLLEWVPVDKHITWHKYVGWLATIAGTIHTLCHTFGVFPKLAGNEPVRAVAGFPPLGGASPVGEYAKLMLLSIPGSTGWALVLVFAILTVTATNRVRRFRFEAFWYTHHLFWAGLALLLVHGLQGVLGPSWAWKYLLVPASLYCLERLVRVLRTFWPSTILHARIEGDTLSLAFTRPWFARSYSAGQYVFLNMPALSNWQWHPFTLTSAPSDPYLSVRIKRAGDWTGLLFDSLAPFATASARASLGPPATSPRSSAFPEHISAVLPRVYVDGPFGASSQDFVNFDRVVFIATGVGATPFLSILRHIEFLVKGQLHDEEERSGEENDGDDDADLDLEAGTITRAKSRFSISRVDFFWVNRDQQGFKWMSQALRDVDPRVLRLLRVHTFLTSAQGNAELTSYLLWWGLQLAKEGPLGGRCALTGLQHSAQYWGRPCWDQVFDQLGQATPAGHQVGVFFCGPKPLGKELYQLVRKTNVTSSGTFFFAKENF